MVKLGVLAENFIKHFQQKILYSRKVKHQFYEKKITFKKENTKTSSCKFFMSSCNVGVSWTRT
jgi:hypothetical protein